MGRRRGGPTVGERRQGRGVGGEHMGGDKETKVEEAEYSVTRWNKWN